MSNKVISLKYKNEYDKRLEETLNYLEELDEGLSSEMIQLATLGKWKEWSDNQPIGTEFTFTNEMLCNTGDENIDTLYELREEVRRKRELLHKSI